jgi:hypothetical protein
MTIPGQGADGHRPPAPPYPEDPTTATRHLCAGAYLDEGFRNDSLRKVYYQPRRVVAPSYGFDAVPVLAHCLRARNGALLRDAAIVVTALIAALVSWASLLFVLSSMASLQAAIATYRVARDSIRKLRRGEPVPLSTLVPRLMLLGLGWTLAFVVGTLASGSLLSATSDSFGETGVSGTETAVAGIAAGSLLLGLLIFAYPVAFNLWRQTELSKMGPGAPLTQPVRTPRLDEIATQQRGNTTVYGGFWPHVGSGHLIETWGFAQRLVRPARDLVREYAHRAQGEPTEREREFAQSPFGAQELVNYVRDHLATLLPQREAEEHIPGLTLQDRICLAGTEVTHLAPYTAPQVMAAVVRHPTTPARHYLACQVFAWGGELITTVYVHISVQGRSLYLELTTTALPPCKVEFRVVDTVEGHGPVAFLRALKDGIADTPRTIWRSPANLVGALINLVAGSANGTAPSVRITRGLNYGAEAGVRELGAEPDMRFLTQYQDVSKFKKLIERRVIAAVLDFLDDRDVDTTEYRARAASVLNVNNGFVNNGSGATFNGPVAGRDVTAGGGTP